MQAWGEFGFRQRRIRKSKAGPVQLGWRRAKRYTCVCESAATGHMSRNRRRLFRTKFAPHWEGSINNPSLRLGRHWVTGMARFRTL